MVNRIIFGNLGSTYGLKVSKPGIDVTDINTTSKDLLFDSTNNNFLRSIVTGTLSLAAGTTASTSVTLGTAYSSLMLMGHLTTALSLTKNELCTDIDGAYYLSLSNAGVITFWRYSTVSLVANSVTYTVFGA